MAMRKEKKGQPHVAIFVEGDMDKVFFNALLNYYRTSSSAPITSCEVVNMKGVSRYTSKFELKLKNDVIPTAAARGLVLKAVCCSYDTDAFEDNDKPVVNWNEVRRKVARLGISEFCKVEVRSMIEDWLLDDMEGLCTFLKLKQVPTSLKGRTGFERIENLFQKAGRRYSKGVSVSDFIGCLNMELIHNKHYSVLQSLENAIGWRENEDNALLSDSINSI